MKARLIVLLAVVVLLLAVGRFVLAEQGGQYVLQSGRGLRASSQPTTLEWQVRGQANGGAYSLSSAAMPELRGSGCCCTYLPALLRSTP